MSEKNDYILYAEKELELNGLINTDVGKQMLQLLKTSWEFGQGNQLMPITVVDMLDRLNKKLPLLPLEEDGMALVHYENGPDRMHHSRYYPVYQTEDGKYYDDRAVGFIRDDGSIAYFYGNSEYNSIKEIQFPYYPKPQYVYISEMNLNEQLDKTMDS